MQTGRVIFGVVLGWQAVLLGGVAQAICDDTSTQLRRSPAQLEAICGLYRSVFATRGLNFTWRDSFGTGINQHFDVQMDDCHWNGRVAFVVLTRQSPDAGKRYQLVEKFQLCTDEGATAHMERVAGIENTSCFTLAHDVYWQISSSFTPVPAGDARQSFANDNARNLCAGYESAAVNDLGLFFNSTLVPTP